ncbi:P-loop containing nucleoside triphosphate hydrolase protein [Lactarius sanguifluus]|nr:P-loop containing nucleoside triphosphate hydrolase protein [Lactarius sanguifluus]
MSIPFNGYRASARLIDYFTSSNPATAGILLVFTIGGACNAGRAFLMRVSGQRIVARLRERTSSGLSAMLYISSHLTFLMLTIVPPISLGAVFYGRYLKKLSNKTQEALGDMTKEALAALRTVQVFNAAPYEEKKFSERIDRVLTLARREAVASGIFFGTTGWSGNVTLLALLGYDLCGGTHQPINLYVRLPLLTFLHTYIRSFFASIMRGIGAGSRIFELLDRSPAIQPGVGVELDPKHTGPLRFENITFSYPTRSGVNVLEEFNLEVKVGENVAVVGRSGGGKSYIHSSLLRYYDPVRGKITFNGRGMRLFLFVEIIPIRVRSPESWRDIIGVVPQDSVLFTGTIASNIAYGNESATREQIEAAAREANREFVWGLPDSFDTPIGRLGLSGRQRQRLAIARALLKKPAILALDEATSSLDASAERCVRTYFPIIRPDLGTLTLSDPARNSRFCSSMAAQLNATGYSEEHVPVVPATGALTRRPRLADEVLLRGEGSPRSKDAGAGTVS